MMKSRESSDRELESPFDLHRIVNDLVAQSQHGKYGDTSGIGQLIHQVCGSNLICSSFDRIVF